MLANRCGYLKQNVIMSIQENQISDLMDGGLISKKELLDKYLYNKKEMLLAYEDGRLDENRFQTEKNYNRVKASDWIKNFKRCPYEKEIIKQHLDYICENWMETSEQDILPTFIRQFTEEITDSWSVLEFLKYLKENDFQIL